MERPFIKFLGTAGARFVVARQLRSSGGVFIYGDGKRLILDPGPGTLVRCASSRPSIDITELDGVILTHNHIDHSNDVNILIDGMTAGGFKRRGLLFAPKEALEGEGAVVLPYLREFLEGIVVLEGEREYSIDGLRFYTSTRHRHPVETYGVKIDLGGKRVSFMVDTGFFPGLIESYRDSDILVMNVVRYRAGNDGIMHLSVEDAKRVIRSLKPEKAILTHFGMTMLRARPHDVARRLSEETGVEVIAASDGMRVEV